MSKHWPILSQIRSPYICTPIRLSLYTTSWLHRRFLLPRRVLNIKFVYNREINRDWLKSHFRQTYIIYCLPRFIFIRRQCDKYLWSKVCTTTTRPRSRQSDQRMSWFVLRNLFLALLYDLCTCVFLLGWMHLQRFQTPEQSFYVISNFSKITTTGCCTVPLCVTRKKIAW